MESLEQARERFAKEIQARGHIRSGALIEGLAKVARERFMGPGPWKILKAPALQGYQLTPDDDPRHLYDNVLVAIDEQRKLNNGEPVGLLLFLDTLDLAPGERLLHIGCGVGYYTAIAAHAVGPHGRVVGVEIDPSLALRAQQNLAACSSIQVICADGARGDFGSFDAIFVNAGCTRVQPQWLKQLAAGGRLLVPLTVSLPTGGGAGAMLLVKRQDSGYSATFTSPVGIFHCEGARSQEEEELLARAFGRGNRAAVVRLRRDAHEPGADCWLHTSGICLQSDPDLRRQRPEAITLSGETLASYVGRYQLARALVLSITQDEHGLLAQMTGQPYASRIYPQSQQEFFSEVSPATITFVADDTGRVTGVVYAMPGKRLEDT